MAVRWMKFFNVLKYSSFFIYTPVSVPNAFKLTSTTDLACRCKVIYPIGLGDRELHKIVLTHWPVAAFLLLLKRKPNLPVQRSHLRRSYS